eukprot:1534049-Prymnesium_polylepis.1
MYDGGEGKMQNDNKKTNAGQATELWSAQCLTHGNLHAPPRPLPTLATPLGLPRAHQLMPPP